MLAFWVIEQLDVFKHVASGLISRPVFVPPDFLALQKLKEALSDGIVMAIPPAAHGVFQTVFSQEGSPLAACELGPLVRVDQQARSGLSSPDCHEQGLHRQFRSLARLDGPANDAP